MPPGLLRLALVAVASGRVGRNRVPEGERWLHGSSRPGWEWAGCAFSPKFLLASGPLPTATREGRAARMWQSAGQDTEQGKLLLSQLTLRPIFPETPTKSPRSVSGDILLLSVKRLFAQSPLSQTNLWLHLGCCRDLSQASFPLTSFFSME